MTARFFLEKEKLLVKLEEEYETEMASSPDEEVRNRGKRK